MKIPMRTEQSKSGLVQLCAELGKRFNIKDCALVEIGSFAGDSAVIFAKFFKTVFCVDNWEGEIKGMKLEDAFAEFKARIEPCGNVMYTRMTSKCASEIVHRIFDGVYIDADHTYESVKQDIALWRGKVRLFVAGHDYHAKKFPGVVRAVNEAFGKPDYVAPDTSWFKIK